LWRAAKPVLDPPDVKPRAIEVVTQLGGRQTIPEGDQDHVASDAVSIRALGVVLAGWLSP
jgi:hypothetical protein